MIAELFGPLGKRYCVLFWAMSAFALIFLVIAGGSVVYMIGTRKIDGPEFYGAIAVSFMYALIYLQNRLLYNMCMR